jgi:polyisoprenoid-binding protein YceI
MPQGWIVPPGSETAMRPLFNRFAAALLVGLLVPQPAPAAPTHYVLQAESSTVGFETGFGEQKITGTIPIQSADLTIDFDRLENCLVAVTLDASRASASFPFAADAMKGATVLDTRRHPTIAFTTTSVAPAGGGASVTGLMTIRGITRPATLNARIYRQKGTVEGDRSRLTVILTGKVHRSDFGAIGWADMVEDTVTLTITARIVAQD